MNTGITLISDDNWNNLKIAFPEVVELLEELPNDTSQTMNILVVQMLSIHEARVTGNNQLANKNRYIEELEKTIIRFKDLVEAQGKTITTTQQNETYLKKELAEVRKNRNKPVNNYCVLYGYLTACMLICAIFLAIHKNEQR